MKRIDIAVVGTGYVGLTSAACFAELGHNVLGIDIDPEKVQSLSQGEVLIHEAGLADLVTAGRANGRLAFTDSFERVGEAPFVLLCLPTPAGPDGSPDISALKTAVTELGPRFAAETVVITKSTVPIGTHQQLKRWLDRDDVHVVSNPEFLREGTAVADFLGPDRVVIGAADPSVGQRVAELYGSLEAEVHLTDPMSAELIKYASNTFLATKLSYVNELARLCDLVGADIDAITAGLAADHRIAAAFLSPGPGWGGSCFPKDAQGLAHAARSTRLKLAVIEGASESNRDHFEHLIWRIGDLCDVPLQDARIAVWGVAFKAGTDDTRSSPALELIHRLHGVHADVRVHDPVATAPAELASGDMYEICDGADLLVVATEWPQYAEADLDAVAARLGRPVVFDTRNVIESEAARASGLVLHRLGRPTAGCVAATDAGA